MNASPSPSPSPSMAPSSSASGSDLSPIGLSVADLSTHLLVFGTTGTGKTSGVLRVAIRASAGPRKTS